MAYNATEERLIAKATAVDLMAVADTTLYTVPASTVFIPTRLVVVPDAKTGGALATPATVSAGTESTTYANMFAALSLTGVGGHRRARHPGASVGREGGARYRGHQGQGQRGGRWA